LGERPGPLAVVGMLLGLGAIVLVSQQTATASSPSPDGRGRAPAGIGIALVSGVAIGLFLLCLAQTRTEAGPWPILASRGTSVVLFGLAAAIAGAPSGFRGPPAHAGGRRGRHVGQCALPRRGAAGPPEHRRDAHLALSGEHGAAGSGGAGRAPQSAAGGG